MPILRTLFLISALFGCVSATSRYTASIVDQDSRLLYVAGFGALHAFDIDHGHRLVHTYPLPQIADKARGITVARKQGALFISYDQRVLAFDIRAGTILWNTELAESDPADRLDISADESELYVPAGFRSKAEKIFVLDPVTGQLRAPIPAAAYGHDALVSADGKRLYLEHYTGTHYFSIFSLPSHALESQVGPFTSDVRPFTLDGAQRYLYVCLTGMLAFDIGEVSTGKMIRHVEVKGFPAIVAKHHGTPSHGIGITPDGRELWLVDTGGSHLHVFDLSNPTDPQQRGSIAVGKEPGWLVFSLDGEYAYPSTGEVIRTKTREIIGALTDANGKHVDAEKAVEIHFRGDTIVSVGKQYSLGNGSRR